MRYRKKTEYSWSPQIAYSVGLIASDGCLSSDGRHIDLTSKDIDQLDNFQRAIGKSISVSEKSNGSKGKSLRIQFSDVAYYDFLLTVGLMPNKSKILPELHIPDEYYAHFLRGLFDGDGTTYAFHDPRWPVSYMYYIAYSSASRLFIEYISSTNIRLLDVKGASIRHAARAFSLVYAKADAHLLYSAMYKDSEDLFLIRKRKKLEGFVRMNGGDIIS